MIVVKAIQIFYEWLSIFYYIFNFMAVEGQGLYLFNSLSLLSSAWRVSINAFEEEDAT